MHLQGTRGHIIDVCICVMLTSEAWDVFKISETSLIPIQLRVRLRLIVRAECLALLNEKFKSIHREENVTASLLFGFQEFISTAYITHWVDPDVCVCRFLMSWLNAWRLSALSWPERIQCKLSNEGNFARGIVFPQLLKISLTQSTH